MSEEKTIGSGKVGFGANAIPGMKTAPVEHVIRAKTRAEMAKNPGVWKTYTELSRNLRIVNRASRGPMAGRAFAARFDGQMWPEGADNDDESTWLQPGEYMDVPKDVALHFCGNIWDSSLPNKLDVIQRYGDWRYKEGQGGTGGMAKMVREGPPELPDLAVIELDGRSKEKGNWKCIYDIYMKGEALVKDLSVDDGALAAAPQETFERVKA